MHIKNESNAYIESLDAFVFDIIPKSVWAAIAISALTSGGDRLSEATNAVMREWEALHQNGIVKQKPKTRKAKNVAAQRNENARLSVL